MSAQVFAAPSRSKRTVASTVTGVKSNPMMQEGPLVLSQPVHAAKTLPASGMAVTVTDPPPPASGKDVQKRAPPRSASLQDPPTPPKSTVPLPEPSVNTLRTAFWNPMSSSPAHAASTPNMGAAKRHDLTCGPCRIVHLHVSQKRRRG